MRSKPPGALIMTALAARTAQMTGMDLIVVAPWVFFGVVLTAVCLRLRRSRRTAAPPREPVDPPGQRADRQETSCPEKNLPPRP